MVTPRFTIFTPFYNRTHLLRRPYESLCNQTVHDFEWLLVDDGSTEDFSEQIAAWSAVAPFPIRYIRKPHGGKPRAHNRAVREARGEFFAVLDSDDALLPTALERLLFHWNSITQPERFSGVTGLCVDEQGVLIGRLFPKDVLDCAHWDAVAKFGGAGERWGFHRTDVLRQFLFPEEFGDEEYCPEALVWNRIGRRYLMRHVNDPLRTFFSSELTISFRLRSVLMRNPKNARAYYAECLQCSGPLRLRYRRAVNYIRYSLHAGAPLWTTISNSPAPPLVAATAPLGFAFFAADLLRAACSSRREPRRAAV